MLSKEFRILIIDDNADIHDDYCKSLGYQPNEDKDTLRDLEKQLFEPKDLPPEPVNQNIYRISSAYQGEVGYNMALQAFVGGKPFALAFVDVRMPPGLDGIQTTRRLLADEPDLEIVLCSAFSDYPWERIKEIIGESDRVLFLRKPFDVIEVKQMADALTRKWQMKREFQALKEELILAKDQALASSREKSAFLSNMSHEIRTPLNGVIGMALLLEQTRLDPEQQEYVTAVRYSADVLLGTIDNILEFSKIEAGKLNLQEITYDLHYLVRGVQTLFAHSFTNRLLSMEITIDEEVPRFVCGDPTRFRQILINLLANALKFTEEGGVAVHLTCLEQESKDLMLKLTVRDTGIGISKEGQKMLFQTFQQVDQGALAKYGGTGLGLVICKMLAQLQGGKIGFESDLGQGSTFWYTIRCRSAHDYIPQINGAPILRGARILICAQELSLRDRLGDLMQSWSCRYSFAATPSDALSMIQDAPEHDPYLVFLVEWEHRNLRQEVLREALVNIKAFQKLACVSLVDLKGNTSIILANEQILGLPLDVKSLHDCLREILQGDVVEEPGQRHLILVVEDNKINQKVVSHILQKGGYQTLVAENGEMALDLYFQNPIDLVVMDCQMPGMDGYQATRLIRKDEPLGRRVPILALTANAMSGDRERCLEAGMDDYITKPLRPSEFLPRIRSLLTRDSV